MSQLVAELREFSHLAAMSAAETPALANEDPDAVARMLRRYVGGRITVHEPPAIGEPRPLNQ